MTRAAPETEARPRSRADRAIALAVGLAAAALYAATWQPAWYGDGIGMLRAVEGGFATPPHPLAVLVPIAIDRVTPLDEVGALRAATVGAAAVGLGATFLLARALGARRAAALGATLLAALAPGLWFFATVVEVHAHHFAVVALATLAATAVGRAPRGRRLLPWIALAIAAPAVVPSHASGKLLIPAIGAWVLAARVAAEPRAPLRAALAPAAGGAALTALGAALAPWLRAALFPGEIAEAGVLAHYLAGGASAWRTLLDGWLLPLGALVPAALAVALARARREPALAAALALAVAPELVFFTWLGWGERGGYALAVLPAAAAAAALWIDRRPRVAALAVPLALALHATLARTWAMEGRDRFLPADRTAAIARALPDGGTLYSLQLSVPHADRELPRVRERSLAGLVTAARNAGVPPEEFGPRLCAEVASGPSAFDLACLENRQLVLAGAAEYLKSLHLALRARPGAREVREGDWRLVVADLPPRVAPEAAR